MKRQGREDSGMCLGLNKKNEGLAWGFRCASVPSEKSKVVCYLAGLELLRAATKSRMCLPTCACLIPCLEEAEGLTSGLWPGHCTLGSRL